MRLASCLTAPQIWSSCASVVGIGLTSHRTRPAQALWPFTAWTVLGLLSVQPALGPFYSKSPTGHAKVSSSKRSRHEAATGSLDSRALASHRMLIGQ